MSLIEDKVCAIIQERTAVGETKYGTTMERTDLSEKEWVQHAQEEALDFAVYLEKLKTEACVLSKREMKKIIELIDFQLEEFPILHNAGYENIKKKLQDALNLEKS